MLREVKAEFFSLTEVSQKLCKFVIYCLQLQLWNRTKLMDTLWFTSKRTKLINMLHIVDAIKVTHKCLNCDKQLSIVSFCNKLENFVCAKKVLLNFFGQLDDITKIIIFHIRFDWSISSKNIFIKLKAKVSNQINYERMFIEPSIK
jgi:hypothetical protein